MLPALLVERKFNMSTTTITKPIKTVDKIKLLDQMLEDIAGDEYDEYGTDENGINANAKHYGDLEALEVMDSTH